jgi:hypothetical protein
MAVVGTDAIYLSHLPMFMRPHDFQVILQGSFGGADAAYRKARAAHPDTKLYTFAPDAFVLPELFPGAGGHPAARTSFTGTLVRNHFEQPAAHPEEPEAVASEVTVDVTRVVFHHQFVESASRPDSLAYLLFGHGKELFLAHLITGPPDFDQLATVQVGGHDFADDELAVGVHVSVPGRADEPTARLKEGQKAAATARLGDADVAVELTVRSELYFETSDLANQM